MKRLVQKLLLLEEPEEKSKRPILEDGDKGIVKSLAALMLHVVEQEKYEEVGDEH